MLTLCGSRTLANRKRKHPKLPQTAFVRSDTGLEAERSACPTQQRWELCSETHHLQWTARRHNERPATRTALIYCLFFWGTGLFFSPAGVEQLHRLSVIFISISWPIKYPQTVLLPGIQPIVTPLWNSHVESHTSQKLSTRWQDVNYSN